MARNFNERLMTVSAQPKATLDTIGAVIIGRNEGQRLVRCLNSVRNHVESVVYVDSGSSDGSTDTAKSLGATVLALDLREPFTAARARNAGLQFFLQSHPSIDHIFFIDGDCEVHDSWIDIARSFLVSHPDVAVVWGRRRERFPERSIYNMLCDIEWASSPIGETKACGGDAVIRVAVLKEVNGYRDDLICGEEPELCVRIRQKGWRIWRLDEEMTIHDAAMYRFDQWWRRNMRSGYGFALGASVHGAPPERHWVKESRRIWIFGLGVPVATICASFIFGLPALLLLGIYPLQLVRLAHFEGRFSRTQWIWAAAMVMGKFPMMLGQVRFVIDRVRRVNSRLIEYK